MVLRLLKKTILLNPFKWKEFSEQSFLHSLKVLSVTLLIAFLIAGILWIPQVVRLKSAMVGELAKFESFQVIPDIAMTGPAMVPPNKPLLIIDMTAPRNISQEYFLVTNESVQFRFFGIHSIPIEHLTQATTHKEEVGKFMATFLAMLVPGIVFFLYVRSWVKYFLLAIAAGTVFFILLDLTKFKLKWKQMLNLSTLMATPMILLETISAPISTAYLKPVCEFLGTKLYLVTLALYAALIITGIVFIHIRQAREKRK